MLGLFTAVAPALPGKLLKLPNLALIGAVVFAIFAASTLGQAALERVPQRWTFPGGCLVLVAGMVLLGIAIGLASLALLVASAVVAGFGRGLSFRAGMAAVTEASSEDRRGEITSTFFVALYFAISVPVIGVGVMTKFLGLRLAWICFTAAMAALAVVALALIVRRRDASRAT